MNNFSVVVACANASGESDFFIADVFASQEEYANGVHYDRAKALAVESDYSGPFVCFDSSEQHRIHNIASLLASRERDQAPPVLPKIVKDIVEGLLKENVTLSGNTLPLSVILVALTRHEYTEEINAPVEFSESDFDQLLVSAYEAANGNAFVMDDEYWEQGASRYEIER